MLNPSPSVAVASHLETTESDITVLSQMLKACADPLRMQILQVLKSDTFGVLELTQLFGTKQSGMSHHLKVLSKAGLVEAQREGNAIFYRRPFMRQTPHDVETIEQLFRMIDRYTLSEALEQGIEEIREQRSVQSRAFFARHASSFSDHQEMICDYEQYAEASFELLSKSGLSRNAHVLELGPGEGQFLKPLSLAYAQVTALDNSSAMLDKARRFAQEEGLRNVSFYLGDTQAFKQENVSVDAMIMNMVLHHVPTPAQIFEDAADLLKSGGLLVVCDLSHHNQEWARENCGDIWLGFEPHQLSRWAERAGLAEEESVFIGLRNGFQIQLRKFLKPAVEPSHSAAS
ncbi:MAG: metalloregulator ArsR/SmtB family transcription factor [Oleiphilaceae bacterium]|nr:metalloregulator ArsR/SmtB family transcription factor [Oleiphilaceae bacterium]